MTDESSVRYVTGECFVTFPNDDAEVRLQDETGAAAADVERLSAELGTIRGEMDALKKVLYARFGSSINLEE